MRKLKPTEAKPPTLPKAKRHAIYRKLLELASKEGFSRKSLDPEEDTDCPVPGLCYALSALSGLCAYETRVMESAFPEIHAQKPRMTAMWWWPVNVWTERKRALRKAIAMTKPIQGFDRRRRPYPRQPK